VSAVDEDVIGDGRKHHRLDVGQAARLRERGLERPLGRVGRTRVDEPPIPAPETVDRQRLRFERTHRKTRRVIVGVARDEREAVHERECLVVGRELGEQVGHRDQHSEPGTPARTAVAGAELHAGAHDLRWRHARVEQTQHRLGDHERDIVLEPVAQPALEMADGIVANPRPHEHVVVPNLDVERARIISPKVEGAARHEIEACVMPVASDEAGLHGSLVQRKPEMGAAIFDRERSAVVPEHDDRQCADLGGQPPGRLQLRQRTRSDVLFSHGRPRD
jgi:hypothetical protein